MGPDERVAAHVRAFNAAVLTGDWPPFVSRFTATARMSFPDLDLPDLVGQAAILHGYRSSPPDDTIAEATVRALPGVDEVSIRWTGGDRGSMRVTWSADLVDSLEIYFD